jgi:hypothetical protein
LGARVAGPLLYPVTAADPRLLLLLTLGVSLVAVLGGILSMLLRGRGMFLAFHVIAPAVVLSCGSMRLCRVLMVLGSFVMFVFGHG